MDTDTGDGLQISQSFYNPPLKHVAGVKKELEILEKLLFEVFHIGLVPLWSFQNEPNWESHPKEEDYVWIIEI